MLRLLAFVLTGACLTMESSQAFLSEGPNGPLVIRQGGTYSGTFISTDASRPCVRILTREPVLLRNSYLKGSGHLIEAAPGAWLTVENCYGRGVLPQIPETARGRFLVAEGARMLRIEHCTMEQTTGIYVLRWSGEGTPEETLTVRYNRSRNIDGRYWNGGRTRASWLSLDKVWRVPGIEIAWNQVINEPDSSLVEDNINFFNSSGTPEKPIQLHNNYIQGAYPYPATSPQYSGSGIMMDGQGATAETTTAYVQAYSNQVINTCNAGMSIAAGHDIRFFQNRVVHSAHLPDGRYLPSTFAGLAIFNHYNMDSSVFNRHSIDHNVVGYNNQNYSAPVSGRQDEHRHACTSCSAQQHLPNPITRRTEQLEWRLWKRKLRRHQVKVGATLTKPPQPANMLARR
ncbi:hypothetical protein [Hymenobacter sp. DG25B]|uniref:hypothetical protein n=1 Tax=Hymenobacter sp. DG25B TaxID=1385664 RepID=UPI000B003C3F|nr:hypothetical protein [Hymenobacter sp. DG25B]